jgi:hypothetical protein
MKTSISLLGVFALVCSQFASADCASTDQACINKLLAETSESGSSAAAGALLLGAAAFGIYKLVTNEDTPEEAQLRAKELSYGLGIRLNSFYSPYRVSFLQPVLLQETEEVKSFESDNFDVRVEAKILNFEYTW